MKSILEDVFDSILIIAFFAVIAWALCQYIDTNTYKQGYSNAVQSTSFKNIVK